MSKTQQKLEPAAKAITLELYGLHLETTSVILQYLFNHPAGCSFDSIVQACYRNKQLKRWIIAHGSKFSSNAAIWCINLLSIQNVITWHPTSRGCKKDVCYLVPDMWLRLATEVRDE